MVSQDTPKARSMPEMYLPRMGQAEEKGRQKMSSRFQIEVVRENNAGNKVRLVKVLPNTRLNYYEAVNIIMSRRINNPNIHVRLVLVDKEELLKVFILYYNTTDRTEVIQYLDTKYNWHSMSARKFIPRMNRRLKRERAWASEVQESESQGSNREAVRA